MGLQNGVCFPIKCRFMQAPFLAHEKIDSSIECTFAQSECVLDVRYWIIKVKRYVLLAVIANC